MNWGNWRSIQHQNISYVSQILFLRPDLPRFMSELQLLEPITDIWETKIGTVVKKNYSFTQQLSGWIRRFTSVRTALKKKGSHKATKPITGSGCRWQELLRWRERSRSREERRLHRYHLHRRLVVLSGGGESKGMRGLGVSPADLERNQFRGTADAQLSGRVAGLRRAVVMAVEPSQDGAGHACGSWAPIGASTSTGALGWIRPQNRIFYGRLQINSYIYIYMTGLFSISGVE